MTMTINHPQSGQYQGHNRLIVAAIGIALAVSLAVVVQVTTSRAGTEATTGQAFDLDQARSAETARLVAVNETPWASATPVTDTQAAETARFVAVNETPWASAAPVVAKQDHASDQAFFLTINDAGDPSTSGATTADGHLAFFLSINDLDG